MIDVSQAVIVILILSITIILAWHLASYIAGVFNRSPSRLDWALNRVEKLIYRLGGTDPSRTMGWKEYLLSALLINVAQMTLAFLILIFQNNSS